MVATVGIPVIGAGLVLSFYIAWCLGANDAANPTQAAVGSGVLSLRRALILFCIFAALGALLQGFMVTKTIGKGVVENVTVVASLAVVLSACIWMTFSTWRGLPVSTTHSIIGSVLGYGLIRSGLDGVNWEVLGGIGLSWAGSPLAAMTISFILYRLMNRVLLTHRNGEWIARAVLVFSLVFSAYAFGANDVANATGVFLSIATELRITRSLLLFGLALLGTAGIAVGAFTWGYKVIDTVGFKITRLDTVMGGAAGLSNAISVYLFTTLPYIFFGWGMPVSTTLASVGAIIGVGLSKNFKTLSKGMVAWIVAAWVLTVPICAALSAAIFYLITHLIDL